ncbi:MAG: ACP S-malonyltransferase [Kofleriaceae bacterium]|nr:ACP S-malonyltransferase [Myxococcales bacterium]MCB9564086.1 ACP S-malonyltransferase [Kofleriaceae bacterium]MCB9572546.1 ACP S-malonyltransferase [Kofleriaceae bacterium]
MKTALLFPGQGSQRVGMGRDLAIRYEAARRVYEEADDALGFAISKLCWEGPEDDLTLTMHTQPAILTTSIAVLRAIESEQPLPFDLVAGHSLGEWTALVAAGALRLADAVRLTHLRGKLMQEAVPVGVGGMAALMGLDAAAVRGVCAEASAPGEPVEAANFNGAGQIVISGHAAAVERAMAAAKAAGAKRAVALTVSAPFHCSLMQPAADGMARALADVTVAAPRVPVVTNVEATANDDPARVKDLLIRQITAPVRWEESVQVLDVAGVTCALELGSGAVLRGLVKRIAPSIEVTTIGEPHEVEGFVKGGT